MILNQHELVVKWKGLIGKDGNDETAEGVVTTFARVEPEPEYFPCYP